MSFLRRARPKGSQITAPLSPGLGPVLDMGSGMHQFFSEIDDEGDSLSLSVVLQAMREVTESAAPKTRSGAGRRKKPETTTKTAAPESRTNLKADEET